MKKLELQKVSAALNLEKEREFDDSKIKIIEPGLETKRAMYARLFREDHDALFSDAEKKSLDCKPFTREELNDWIKRRWQLLQLDPAVQSDKRALRDARNMVVSEMNIAASTSYGGHPPFRLSMHSSGNYKVFMEWSVLDSVAQEGVKNLKSLVKSVQTSILRLAKTAEAKYDFGHLRDEDRGRAEESLYHLRKDVQQALIETSIRCQHLHNGICLQTKRFNLMIRPPASLALAEPSKN